MRMSRMLCLLVTAALALVAIPASASAEVEIGSEEEFSISGTFQSGNYYKGMPIPQESCLYEATGTISTSGAVDVYPMSFKMLSTGDCSPPRLWNDCNDAGWSGQMVEPGDEAYLGNADFEVVMTVCFEWAMQNAGSPFEARIHLNEGASGQEWSWPQQKMGNFTSAWLELAPFEMGIDELEIS